MCKMRARTEIIGLELATRWFQQLQDTLTAGFERLDGAAKFSEDKWEREGGGGGRSRVLVDGAVFEKLGVNFSDVHGDMPEAFASEVPGSGTSFRASGVSIVAHTQNPWVPGFHANVRMIHKGDKIWCGGGADLTPYYGDLEDAQHFHRTFKKACDAHSEAFYPRFKAWCDRYFYLPHREETRGYGGIFFDYVGLAKSELPARSVARNPDVLEDAVPVETAWSLARRVGQSLLDAYAPIVTRHKDRPFTEAQREWQLVRRGRYAEFNLLYDRGTQFGLRTGGRVESILMSMPPLTRWSYNVQPAAGTPEAELIDYLRPRDWLES